jgi:hypothetical protein
VNQLSSGLNGLSGVVGREGGGLLGKEGEGGLLNRSHSH